MTALPRIGAAAGVIVLVLLASGAILGGWPFDADAPDADAPDADAPDADAPDADAPGRSDAYAERVRALRRVGAWAPVFGGGDVGQLDGYDLVVVDGTPDQGGDVDVAPDVVDRLREDALVLAYLSIGTIEDWRAHADGLPADARLGPVEGWPGEWYVDAGNAVWQERIVEVATMLRDVGFDGLYLDNLDVAEVEPTTAGGVVALVERLRRAHPDLLLVAQNGLAVLDRLAVDAVAHEDAFWRWDGGYRRSSDDERDALLAGLRAAHGRGLPVFTLDYAPDGCPCAREIVDASLAEGFVPAVSTLELDRPPHAPLVGS